MRSNFWYKPFTYVPPVIEKVKDRKGNEREIIKKPGYLKLTYEAGTVLKSGGREYVVQESGALKRKDINRAQRRRDKNRPKKEGK